MKRKDERKKLPKPERKREAGAEKAIPTPEAMWELFLRYIVYNEAHPKIKNEIAQKYGEIIAVPIVPPLTWSGFDVYLDMVENVILDTRDYRDNTDGRYDEYKAIVTRIDRTVYESKYSGAACNIYNSSIIARDLGLTDAQKVEHSGELKTDPIKVIKVTVHESGTLEES